MSRTQLTTEEIHTLRESKYIYAVTSTRVSYTKEFKQIVYDESNAGKPIREIFADHGIDPELLGKSRIYSARKHILNEYKEYGCFCEGYGKHSSGNITENASTDKDITDSQRLKKLQTQVDYLSQEVEFLKKISSIRNTRK